MDHLQRLSLSTPPSPNFVDLPWELRRQIYVLLIKAVHPPAKIYLRSNGQVISRGLAYNKQFEPLLRLRYVCRALRDEILDLVFKDSQIDIHIIPDAHLSTTSSLAKRSSIFNLHSPFDILKTATIHLTTSEPSKLKLKSFLPLLSRLSALETLVLDFERVSARHLRHFEHLRELYRKRQDDFIIISKPNSTNLPVVATNTTAPAQVNLNTNIPVVNNHVSSDDALDKRKRDRDTLLGWTSWYLTQRFCQYSSAGSIASTFDFTVDELGTLDGTQPMTMRWPELVAFSHWQMLLDQRRRISEQNYTGNGKGKENIRRDGKDELQLQVKCTLVCDYVEVEFHLNLSPYRPQPHHTPKIHLLSLETKPSSPRFHLFSIDVPDHRTANIDNFFGNGDFDDPSELLSSASSLAGSDGYQDTILEEEERERIPALSNMGYLNNDFNGRSDGAEDSEQGDNSIRTEDVEDWLIGKRKKGKGAAELLGML